VPDKYFADFFRGCIDGDGTILVYTDRHHATRNATYVYERLYVSIVSASRPFVIWLRETIARLTGAHGAVYHKSGRNAARSGLFGSPNGNRCGCCRGCTHRPRRHV
jgi:hypothetical protein